MKQKADSINWINLKDKRCPKCGFILVVRGLLDPTFNCSNLNCDFKISGMKFNSVLSKMLNKPTKGLVLDENLSDLNNLGREEISEGFLEPLKEDE